MKRQLLDTIRQIWKVPLFEKLLVSLTQGRKFGTVITKLPPNHYQYPLKTMRKANRDGINYMLDLSDVIDWFIYFGFIEVSRQKLYNLVKKNFTVFDIGSNVGDVSMHCAKLVGLNGQIHSFEPDSENHSRQIMNLSLNSFSNIQVNKLGLGKETGTYAMYNMEINNKGKNRILMTPRTDLQSSMISVTTLDDYVISHHIHKLDLIKIDTEGFEYNVLLGGRNALTRFKPLLFIELDDENLRQQGCAPEDLIQFLVDSGYSLRHAETDTVITPDQNFADVHIDIIGFPEVIER